MDERFDCQKFPLTCLLDKDLLEKSEASRIQNCVVGFFGLALGLVKANILCLALVLMAPRSCVS